MAVAPPSTHHSHLDPIDLHLRLTSRSSYGRKFLSTADPTYNPKEKSGDHITRSGSCYRRDPSVKDSTNSSPELVARAETPRRFTHRKRAPESRSREWDSWKVVPRYHSPERSPPRDESGYPLSETIQKAKLPPNFRMPQCDLYDGTGDPGEHVYQFETNMLFLQVSNAVMCRAFPTTLRKAAHAWFKSLQPRSIYSFGQLSDLFQKHFVSSRSRRKNSASLLNIVQEKNESLACFLERFNVATLEIDNLDESVKYTAFLRGLQYTSKFAFSVNKSPPGNMKALLEKANKYIQAEEYLKTHRGRQEEGKEKQKKRSRELTPQGGKPSKRSKRDERRPKDPFAFENLTPLNTPHDDPLVVTIKAGNFEVKRVLVDNRSPLCIQRHIGMTGTQPVAGCGVNLPPQNEISYRKQDRRGERRPDYNPLASADATDVRRSVYLEFLKDHSISSQTEIGVIDKEPCWMDTFIKFLSTGKLPSERHEARNLRVRAARYALVEGVLYKKSFSLPYLRCLRPSESVYALQEVHEGIYDQHLGERTLAQKILRKGYYWPTMQKDAIEFTRRCDKCQKFMPISHTPVAPLTSVVSPIPFSMWGMDLLRPFPMPSGQRRFVVVALDYFTKWTEAESLATITSAKCEDFFWKNVVCHFGVPRALVVDNGK
ncbi:hypothetical protein RJ639_005209 [Escallonia herrerae]|uniref:Integrase catalytic domain-containing protein n=1 Tax=Escallonia herrerae TaxID=1293975 RepID=A0AA88W225_9ASTE|nr:hypothetical protein RJ639_005209 [Escallonia herrerae]